MWHWRLELCLTYYSFFIYRRLTRFYPPLTRFYPPIIISSISNEFALREKFVVFWCTNLQLTAERSHYLMWLKSLCSWVKARQRWVKAGDGTCPRTQSVVQHTVAYCTTVPKWKGKNATNVDFLENPICKHNHAFYQNQITASYNVWIYFACEFE